MSLLDVEMVDAFENVSELYADWVAVYGEETATEFLQWLAMPVESEWFPT